jgi:hypothetical protein
LIGSVIPLSILSRQARADDHCMLGEDAKMTLYIPKGCTKIRVRSTLDNKEVFDRQLDVQGGQAIEVTFVEFNG